MQRKILVLLFAMLLAFPLMTTTSHADELKGLTLEKEVRAMMELGIIKGFADGKVHPKADVSRGDFAAFLSRTLKLPTTAPTFKDVNASSAIAGEIGAIQQTGIMKGTLDGNFMPLKLMTREEMAVTTARTLTYLKLPVKTETIKISDRTRFSMSDGETSAKLVYSVGIMNGTKMNATRTEMTFDPKGLSKRDQVAAVLNRFLNYKNENEGLAPEPEKPTPTPPTTPPVVDPTKFQLAVVENSKLVVLDKTYDTYQSAVAAFTANASAQGIYKGKELLRVKSGRAFAQGPAGNNTILYATSSFGAQLTYIEAGREMQILGHDEKFMKVQIADTVGYVKHNQIDFVPTAISANRDYYVVNTSNELLHYTYNYLTKGFGAYSIGPGPSFMKPGVSYYSADGVNFLDAAGKSVGTHHPYFQFQSIRTKSKYTAEELDAYIMTKLRQQESVHSRYAGASVTSKLIGTGAYMKQMEELHRVNALFILATAIHESDYGISGNAMKKNNLFGIKVFDSTPEAGEKYATPQRSIEAFVLEYANKNYGPPSGAYAKGAVPGNKTAGFNAHYASDPTWGAKIGGHMWRIDQALDGRDYNQYRLGMTNQSGNLNVRTEPLGPILYSYKPRDLGRSGKTGYPVAIIEQKVGSDGYNWYKILSDAIMKDSSGNSVEYGWVRGDLIIDIGQ